MNESNHITSGWFEHVRTIRSLSVGFNIFTNRKFVKLQRQIRESSNMFLLLTWNISLLPEPRERFARFFFTTAVGLATGLTDLQMVFDEYLDTWDTYHIGYQYQTYHIGLTNGIPNPTVIPIWIPGIPGIPMDTWDPRSSGTYFFAFRIFAGTIFWEPWDDAPSSPFLWRNYLARTLV